jgi:hypothetical protein
MIALYKLGYKQTRYTAMKKGAQFLMSCQNYLNKGGIDDGLICGGKNSSGQYESWRWTSDNAYSYWALKAAEYWAKEEATLGYQSELVFAGQCKAAAARVLAGINTVLRVTNVNDPDYGVWRVAVDGQHDPQLPSGKEWINYAPQMLDVPATGVGKALVGEWIHRNLQDQSGACVWNTLDWGKNKLSPGYSFQASLSWLDLKQNNYADAALEWALGSGLWYSGGGWIDWVENGQPAADWQRFIDTSFYAIAAFRGGYDFRILDMTAPSIPVVKDTRKYTASTTALSCTWSAVDLISGITGYQYKITRDSASGAVVKNWTLTDTQASVTVAGLALTPGKKYYFSVKARNAAGLWSGSGVSDGITVDNSPPVIPVVTDSGVSTQSTVSLSASWQSSDPVSGILEYQFQVTQDSPSGSIVRNWASAGTKTSIVAAGLTLQAGKTYYFRVKAKNGAGLWSSIGASNGITVVR